jgi:hypothetical protein
MKFTAATLIAAAFLAADSVTAFQTQAFGLARRTVTTSLSAGGNGMDMSGNSWKPDSEKMGSTDTGDYYPDDYDAGVEFTDGMMGSQSNGKGGDRSGPQLPGMENLGEGAIMMGGITLAEGIPDGMEFVPSSVPDGEFQMRVPASSNGQDLIIEVKPVCMTFEDYFASFSADSSPIFKVGPATGRMDRRGGEISVLTVRVEPNGQAGEFVGNLVMNLPEDNSKICYKITATCF